VKTIAISTTRHEELIDITHLISKELATAAIDSGIVHVFIPHTTAGVTINENADPDVVDDLLKGFNEFVPRKGFKHSEGNSPAHIKSSLVGVSLVVSVFQSKLVLGRWQGIYFCEFDGPRKRLINVKVIFDG
jgi:secondary thiamine-phosphate synthase enzyme